MKNHIIIIGICVISILMNACNLKGTKNQELSRQDNSKISLDWVGTYAGNIPCADCPYIITHITLNADETYSLQMEYEGKEGEVFSNKGTFQWDEAGTIIILDGLKEESMPSI
jgi:uncharacterized lipoprotein NlpE involved in copper resistance